MGRLDKLKRQLIKEANIRVLNEQSTLDIKEIIRNFEPNESCFSKEFSHIFGPPGEAEVLDLHIDQSTLNSFPTTLKYENILKDKGFKDEGFYPEIGNVWSLLDEEMKDYKRRPVVVILTNYFNESGQNYEGIYTIYDPTLEDNYSKCAPIGASPWNVGPAGTVPKDGNPESKSYHQNKYKLGLKSFKEDLRSYELLDASHPLKKDDDS